MESKSRTENSIRNVIIGFALHIFTLCLSFVVKTIFIKVLGSEYLGIKDLYSNILMILSLTDLGIGNAIIFCIYKPVAEGNTKKISALMCYYKKCLNIICIIVLFVGIGFIPFLKYIVNASLSQRELIIYYLLFLFNTVASYLFSYRAIIISANQEMYLQKICYSIICIIKSALEIIVILFLKSFLMYLIIDILSTLLFNITVSTVAQVRYPYIREKVNLSHKEKKEILNNIKAMLPYKIGYVILYNTDNILLSILVGTIAVGYFSNYMTIILAISEFANIVIRSLQYSVGNFNVNADSERKFKLFKKLQFLSFWIYGVTGICLYILLNDFITLWIGEKFLLSQPVILINIINYYYLGIYNIISIFRETTELFKKTKYVMLITAILNIVFSIILGSKFGLFGIILGTIISYWLTLYWYEPYCLYKIYFKKNFKGYIITSLKQLVCLLICGLMMFVFMDYFVPSNFLLFFVKAFMCFIITNFLMFLFNIKSKDFWEIFTILKNKFLK